MATSALLPPPRPTKIPGKGNGRVGPIPTHPSLLLLELSRNASELAQIHSRLIKLGLIHQPLAFTRLMAALSLSPHGDMNYAQSIFDRDKNPNLFVYNVMIRGYSQSHRPENALSMFYRMICDEDSAPNGLTFPFVLKACSRLGSVEEGRQVHGQVFKYGLDSDVFIQNALILMYASAGCVSYASQVFEKMDRGDVVSWNSMIAGLVDSGFVVEARELFDRMPERNTISWNCLIDGHVKLGLLGIARGLFDQMSIKDSVTWNTMIGGYVSSGLMEDACWLFNQMPSEMKDLITFNMMIDGYMKDCRFKEVLELFREMQVGKLKPNNFTMVSSLSACSNLGALEQGEWIRAYIESNRIGLDAILGTALMDMYAKCGKIERALSVFKSMEERDVGAWNSIISSLGIHGFGKKAMVLFSEMMESEIVPVELTFVSILSACRHSGLVEEGRRCFHLMTEVYDIVPKVEHYGCMVDLLGRAGLLDEAKELIEAMDADSSVPMWGALLGACSRLGNLEMGEYAAKHLLELDHSDPSCYVILSNMYASVGRWDAAIEVRRRMRDDGIDKLPGCSSIEVNGVVHEFRVGDYLNPFEEMV
ncbi:pentatricopeptide repeat-containing protein At4g18840-like [Magnolia sinica]|uniref:pentatricopeptide repeat-containing protein At4g18840-like n=1 Tax=Magnolia sinica TaxID=86752 RepID=UPI002658E4E5|nr:pentatricopeptide repeat-containing protein At4g18840-like [Magnolia sinica]